MRWLKININNVSIIEFEGELYLSLNDLREHYRDTLVTIRKRYEDNPQLIPMIKSNKNTYILQEKLNELAL